MLYGVGRGIESQIFIHPVIFSKFMRLETDWQHDLKNYSETAVLPMKTYNA